MGNINLLYEWPKPEDFLEEIIKNKILPIPKYPLHKNVQGTEKVTVL